jgi:DNA-binding LacI/PurR family transcriptional regulator
MKCENRKRYTIEARDRKVIGAMRKLGYAEVGRRAGLTKGCVSQWANGDMPLPEETVVRILAGAGLDPAAILNAAR